MGVFKERLIIIDTPRFDSGGEFKPTVKGVDGDADGDLCCVQLRICAAEQLSVNFLFHAPVPLPFCRDFLAGPSFHFLGDRDFALLETLPGKAIDFFIIALDTPRFDLSGDFKPTVKGIDGNDNNLHCM